MVDGVPFTLSYSVMPDHRAASKGLGNTYSVRKFSHYGRQAGNGNPRPTLATVGVLAQQETISGGVHSPFTERTRWRETCP
jgi:hypothetical protein